MVLLIVGCSVNEADRKNERLDIQKKMATYIIQNYDGIERLTINDFYEDKKTGFYSSEIIINDIYRTVARVNKQSNTVSLDYGEDFFINIKKIPSKKTLEQIEIKYFEE